MTTKTLARPAQSSAFIYGGPATGKTVLVNRIADAARANGRPVFASSGRLNAREALFEVIDQYMDVPAHDVVQRPLLVLDDLPSADVDEEAEYLSDLTQITLLCCPSVQVLVTSETAESHPEIVAHLPASFPMVLGVADASTLPGLGDSTMMPRADRDRLVSQIQLIK